MRRRCRTKTVQLVRGSVGLGLALGRATRPPAARTATERLSDSEITRCTNIPPFTTPCGPASSARGPGAEPPIDLDTMLDITAAAERRRREVRRRRSVSLRSARQHRFDRRRPEAAGRQDRPAQSRRRFARRAGVAADRRRLGDGQRRGAESVRHAGAARPARSARSSSDLGIRKYGVVRIDSAASPADWAKDPAGNHEEDRRDVPAGVRRRRGVRRAARGRRRNLLGRHAQREAQRRAARDGEPSEDARLPGRHGAHAALHAGLQRARGSHPAGELRLVGPRRRSTRRSRR